MNLVHNCVLTNGENIPIGKWSRQAHRCFQFMVIILCPSPSYSIVWRLSALTVKAL